MVHWRSRGGGRWPKVLLISGQIKLARDEFKATHRPKLKIRQFTLGQTGNVPFVQFMVVNVGNTDATLIDRNQTIVYGKFLNSRGPLTTSDTPTKESGKLAPGEFRYVRLPEVPVDSPEGWEQAMSLAVGNLPIFVFGYVTYSDRERCSPQVWLSPRIQFG